RDDVAAGLEEVDPELVPALLDGRLGQGDGLGDDVVQAQPLGAELDLPGVDPRQVQEIVDEAGEMARLSLDGLLRAPHPGIGRVPEEELEHAETVPEDRKSV